MSNPVIDRLGDRPRELSTEYSRAVTLDDVVVKTALTWLMVVAAGIASFAFAAVNPTVAVPLSLGAALAGFALAMFMIFGRRATSPAFVLSYAALEGTVLGPFSYVVAGTVAGNVDAGTLVGQAVIGTLAVFGACLIAYKSRVIRVTSGLVKGVSVALMAAVALMVVDIVAMLLGFDTGLRSGGPLAIVFSLVCIAIAAACFMVDFSEIEDMVNAGAPEKAAWEAAFGLTITLVWLYMEILRLLSYMYGGKR